MKSVEMHAWLSGGEIARSDCWLCKHEDLSSNPLAPTFKSRVGVDMATYVYKLSTGSGDMQIPKAFWSASLVKTVSLWLVQ